MSEELILRDILSRKDPHGYYVIPMKEEALEVVRRFLSRPGVIIVEYNDVILFKTRSRSLADRVARLLARKGLLALEDEI